MKITDFRRKLDHRRKLEIIDGELEVKGSKEPFRHNTPILHLCPLTPLVFPSRSCISACNLILQELIHTILVYVTVKRISSQVFCSIYPAMLRM